MGAKGLIHVLDRLMTAYGLIRLAYMPDWHGEIMR